MGWVTLEIRRECGRIQIRSRLPTDELVPEGRPSSEKNGETTKLSATLHYRKSYLRDTFEDVDRVGTTELTQIQTD